MFGGKHIFSLSTHLVQQKRWRGGGRWAGDQERGGGTLVNSNQRKSHETVDDNDKLDTERVRGASQHVTLVQTHSVILGFYR